MRILFNALGCGLGNNGGSKTIVTCCNTINNLPGQEACILTTIDSYDFTNKTNVIEIHSEYASGGVLGYLLLNDYDVVVNVSVWDVDTTLEMDIHKKVWWVRGIENWVKGEKYFFNKIVEFSKHGEIFVNSTWMINYIKEKTDGIVKPKLQFAGVEFDQYYPLEDSLRDCQEDGMQIHIGGLGPSKHTTKNYNSFKNIKRYFEDDDKYVFHELSGDCDSYEKLRFFYNKCDIWLALSWWEGFHQCPIEAALCGCLVIYNNIGSGGTLDYCRTNTGMSFLTTHDLVESIQNPEFEKVEVMQNYIQKNIPSKPEAMVRFIYEMEEIINEKLTSGYGYGSGDGSG